MYSEIFASESRLDAGDWNLVSRDFSELRAGFGLAKLATGESMRCSDVSGAGALRRCELGKGDQHTGRNLGGSERTFGGFERVSWVR